MAKVRSPEYPAIGLKEAVEKVNAVYQKDYQNKLPKLVMATHMGYKGLNGTSLPALSAMNKFGLIEGRGDETRVSDLGLAVVAHAPGTPERIQALRTAAASPELFAELDAKFAGGKASDAAIRSYLLTQRFIPSAADTAVRTYRETKQFVESESGGYIGGEQRTEPVLTPQNQPSVEVERLLSRKSGDIKPPAMLQEVFNLEVGPVTVSYPASLSEDDYADMAAQLELLLRRAKRRVTKPGSEEAAN